MSGTDDRTSGSGLHDAREPAQRLQLAPAARADAMLELVPDLIGGGHSVGVQLIKKWVTAGEFFNQVRVQPQSVLKRPAVRRRWRPEIERDRSMRAYGQNPRALRLIEGGGDETG